MKISIKHILRLWLVLLIAIAALLYGAYSKLNPQSLVKLLNQHVEKNYPGSVVHVGKVDYKFALDFTLELQKLRIVRGSQQIADAGLVEVKIPWWLLVFNRGSVLVTLNDLNLYVSKNNSTEVLEKKKNNNSIISFNIPTYLSEASYSLRVHQVAIKELGGDRNFFTLSKFLVRDFQYGKNSAFEINIPISITASGKRYSSELWLFGDVTPDVSEWLLNYRGEFKTKDSSDSFHFDDLVIDGKANVNTSTYDISSQLSMLIDKREIGQGSLTSHLDKMELAMKFSQLPIEYLLLAGNPIRNPFWEKMEGNGAGELKFSHQADKENYFALSGKVNFPGEFKFAGDLTIPGKWLLKFENSNWETSFISNSGQVNFFKRAAIDFKTGEINQYSQEIGLNGVDIHQGPIPVDSISAYIKNDSMIFHSSYIVLKKCVYGKNMIDGSFLYGKNPDQKFYQADLVNNSAKMSLKFSSKESLSNNFEINFTSFPWLNFSFLQPLFSLEEGQINGSLKGEWKESFLTGNWVTKLNLTNSKNLNGELTNILNFMNKNFDIDSSILTSSSLEATLSKELLKIKYVMGDKNPSVLSGTLSLNNKLKSSLTLSYPKNRAIRPLRKEVPNFTWPGGSDE